jgi:hypothetical protein
VSARLAKPPPPISEMWQVYIQSPPEPVDIFEVGVDSKSSFYAGAGAMLMYATSHGVTREELVVMLNEIMGEFRG